MEAKVRAALKDCRRLWRFRHEYDEFCRPEAGVYFIDKEDVNQSNVEIVGLGTDRRKSRRAALAVMNEILGGGFGSRLFQKVGRSWDWRTGWRRLRNAVRPSCLVQAEVAD